MPAEDHLADLLVEYGPPVLDLSLRFRVHALMTWLEARREPGRAPGATAGFLRGALGIALRLIRAGAPLRVDGLEEERVVAPGERDGLLRRRGPDRAAPGRAGSLGAACLIWDAL